MQTFAMILLYVNSLAVIPGYGTRNECEAAARIVTESLRDAGGYRVITRCVPGPVEVR